jgi:hypothetical protein
MMSLQNKNNYDLNQRYTQTFSASPYSKKGDPLDEFLEFWRPIIQKMKEILEIKNFLNEFSSCLSQPHIVTNLSQTPITRPTIPPVTTTPLQQSPSQPVQSQPEQGQEQKNEKIINPRTDLITDLFITSTFMAPDLQRRARGVGEREQHSINIPQEPSLPPSMITTAPHDDNNNNCKKRGGEPNPITENTKEQELKEDRHDIEEYHIEELPSSKSNLLIDNEDDYVINNNIDYDDESSNIDNNYDYSSDVSLVIKRDDHGDIYE